MGHMATFARFANGQSRFAVFKAEFSLRLGLFVNNLGEAPSSNRVTL